MYVPNQIVDASCQLLSELRDRSYQLMCPIVDEDDNLPHLNQVKDSSITATGGYIEVSTNVAIFQIVLWFSIVLVLTLLAAIYALFGMDVGHQTNTFLLPAKTK